MSNAGVFLLFGGGAGLLAFALAVLFATTGRRYGTVLLFGVVLAAAWFGYVLLTADTDPNHPDCSDCDYIWAAGGGRRWWRSSSASTSLAGSSGRPAAGSRAGWCGRLHKGVWPLLFT
jgi:hypothetical protein